MEIKNQESILKYLQITLLSYSRICHFTPLHDEQNRVKVRFQQVTPKGIKMLLDEAPNGLDGHLVFYSYTFIFRFPTQLVQSPEPGVHLCKIPEVLETYDRRKHARLKFESQENKIVKIYNKTRDNYFRGILTDISAGGLGVSIIDLEFRPEMEDIIQTEVTLNGKRFLFDATIAQVRGEIAGCSFIGITGERQKELNEIVESEIKLRSDQMLRNLKKREEMLPNIYKPWDEKEQSDEKATEDAIDMDKMDLIQPISYSTLKVFSELLGLEIREKSVTNRDRLIPRFEISVLLDIFFEDILGKVVLNLSKKLALKIFEILLMEEAEDFNDEVKDAIAEVCNMITGNAKNEFEKQGLYYKLSTPVVLKSREKVTIYSRNMKFLSSVYWTSEGFFDLSFSFSKK